MQAQQGKTDRQEGQPPTEPSSSQPEQLGPAETSASSQQQASSGSSRGGSRQRGSGRGRGRNQRQKQEEQPRAPSETKLEKQDESSLLEDFNPFNLGRRSRAVLDSVWQQVTRISSPTSSSLPFEDDQRINFTAPTEFDTPEAATTSVLVVGATGRVGRVLVRKLVLRGYRVRAMIRKGSSSVGGEGFPRSVEVVEGDVTDYESCRTACTGVDKVASASSHAALCVRLPHIDSCSAGVESNFCTSD